MFISLNRRFARRDDTGAAGGYVVTFILAFVSLLLVFGLASGGWSKADSGHYLIVRNGGPFSNTNIRQVLQPGSSLTFVGFFSSEHKWPSQERFYTISGNPNEGDKAGVDVEILPTSDGVQVGIEGTVYFTLTSDPEKLKELDNKYGTRTYPTVNGKQKYAWDGDDGWSAFLNSVVRPVITNALREQVGGVRCSQLQASCSLVQNTQNVDQAADPNLNNQNLAKIQDGVQTTLTADLNQTLGGEYLVNVRFRLARIALPDQLQKAIDSAQAAYAGVSESQANLKKAQVDAQANRERQKGYEACPTCAQIDVIKALPPGLTTYAPGSPFAVTPK